MDSLWTLSSTKLFHSLFCTVYKEPRKPYNKYMKAVYTGAYSRKSDFDEKVLQ